MKRSFKNYAQIAFKGSNYDLIEALHLKLESVSPDIEARYTTQYVRFWLGKTIVLGVYPKKQHIEVLFNIPYKELDDPDGVASSAVERYPDKLHLGWPTVVSVVDYNREAQIPHIVSFYKQSLEYVRRTK